MAKAPTSDAIMPPEKMKPLLALSKQEPVQAAIGLTADGDGLILLDKKAKPKKVLSMLRAAAGKAKLQLNNATLRFGRAMVDTDYDSGMVRFFVNKETPGNMRVKLVEVVKRIPYQKVELNVDPSLEEEPEEEGAAESEAAAPQPGTSAEPSQPSAPQPSAPRPDPSALTAELSALARRLPEVPASEAAAKAQLVKLATDANGAIKSGALEQAAALVAQLRDGLREALDAAGVGIGGVAGAAPTPAALTTELGVLARRIAEVAGADAGLRGTLAKQAGEVQAAIKGGDMAAAAAGMAGLRAAIEQQVVRTAAGPALAAWKAARGTALSGLNAIMAEVEKMDFVDAPEAVILLRAIAANLTEEPTSRQQVAELRRYLEEDDNVAEAEEPNGFGIELALRAPLLGALSGLETALPG